MTVGDWLGVTDDAVVARAAAHLAARARRLLRRRAAPSRSPPTSTSCSSSRAWPRPIPVRRVERLLALAWESGATPVVVLTKADLHPDPEAAARDLAPHAPGVAVVVVRAADGDVAALAPYSHAGHHAGAARRVRRREVDRRQRAGRRARSCRPATSATSTARAGTPPPTASWSCCRPARSSSTPPGCAASRSPAPRRASRSPSPTWRSWPRPAASPTAPTSASPAARCRPASTRATCRRRGWQSWRKLQRELAFQARRTDAPAARRGAGEVEGDHQGPPRAPAGRAP